MVLRLPDSWSNWNLEMLVFEERGKPENPEKNLSDQGREPTTNLTYIWLDAGIWTRTTLVGGERSHHWAIPYSPQGDYHSGLKTAPFCELLKPERITDTSMSPDAVTRGCKVAANGEVCHVIAWSACVLEIGHVRLSQSTKCTFFRYSI